MNTTIGLIGLGLIGGSIARRYKEHTPSCTIMAYSRTRSSLEEAKKDGVIDLILDTIDEQLLACDYIFLCTPVAFNAQYLQEIKPYLSPSCIVTDVGSTKTDIHETVIRLALEDSFIGGHPMAGSERIGYANSSSTLFENAYYVLTPTARTSKAALTRLQELVVSLGAIPLVLDYQEHDRAVAGISHLPHIIAASLVNLVADSDSEEEIMRRIAAGGFKDITRIASSSPEMWQQICLANQKPLIQLLSAYITSLNHILEDIRESRPDNLYELFERAGEYRNSITDKAKGTLTPEYALYCDIADQAGAIATIATSLAIHQISIKNIGIIHNREFEQGVLKIEFYEEDACSKAGILLRSSQYQIYER